MARPSASYHAARLRHIDRLAFQATVPQLRNMQVALEARMWELRQVADAQPVAELARPLYAATFPVLRSLEIIKLALEIAAARRINNLAVARRAGERGQARRGSLTLQAMMQRPAARQQMGRAIFRASRERVIW